MKIYKIIISFLLFIILAGIAFYLGGIINILYLIVSMGIYAIFFYIISIFWCKLRKKEISDSGVFLQNFFYRILIIISIIIAIGAGISYYANSIKPTSLSQYTLSNNEKTVIFQSMIHIGRDDFYKSVQEELQTAKENGYVYFYEGVRPGTVENMNQFNDALGVQFTPDLYENLSKLYGLGFQDNQIFLNLVNDKDFNIDAGIDDIMKQYNERIDTTKGQVNHKKAVDINSELIEVLSELNTKELAILQYINKAILNILLGGSIDIENLAGVNDSILFDIILHERNKIVAEEIMNSSYDKIFVTYGGLHFEGILSELQKKDPQWKVVEEKTFYPITPIKK